MNDPIKDYCSSVLSFGTCLKTKSIYDKVNGKLCICKYCEEIIKSM